MLINKKYNFNYLFTIIIYLILIKKTYCVNNSRKNIENINKVEILYKNLSHFILSEQECLSETISLNLFMKGFSDSICINENYYFYPYYSKKYFADISSLPIEYFNKNLFFYWIEKEGFNYAISRLTNCIRCVKNNKKFEEYCKECAALKIINNIKILSMDQTLDEIILKNKSIVRFGDGEFNIMFGKSMKGYQNSNKKIVDRLKEIFINSEENLIIGIWNAIQDNYRNKFYRNNFGDKRYWKRWTNNNKYNLVKIIDLGKVYGSTEISRFYLNYKDRSHIKEYVNKLKKIWDKRDVVMIEGQKTRLGIGNDLFDNAKSIQRILCPYNNAFDLYDKIYNEAIKINKEKLIIISLGPTATVLAYDLYKVGYQTIDIGHADIEYEWYLKNATKKENIENKFVYESRRKLKYNDDNVEDENYNKQIIAEILK